MALLTLVAMKGEHAKAEKQILTATSSKVMPVSGTSWNLDLLRPKSMGPPIGPIGLPPCPPPARLRSDIHVKGWPLHLRRILPCLPCPDDT